ncbi:hypothetical protein GF327_06755 [Candidatus Woesearchaeota archaeon]|nr:hypothetical protein [Candidatus Woesearchaeota archaeon]
MDSQTLIIIRIISSFIGIVLAGFGFQMLYSFRKLEKIIIAAACFVAGILLLLFGLGFINFNIPFT